MTKKMHMALLCAVAIIGLLISPVTAVDPALGEPLYRPFDYAQDHPDIDGDMIVWEDDRNGQKDIYFGTIDAFRASSGYTGERITADPNSQERPSISGDYIVWQDNRHGNWDICLYQRSTNTTTQLTNDTGKQWLPAVSGNHVAWYDDSSGRTNIVLYDIAAEEVKDVIDSDAMTTIPYYTTEFKPALSENYVAWVEKADQNVYYYDIGDSEIKGPVSTNTAIQSWPSLSGSAIAWEDYRHGGFGSEIYMTDLANPSLEEQRITNTTGDQVSPALSESIIAWEDMRDGKRSIYMYDLTTKEEMSVFLSPMATDEQLYPAVSGNAIVWQRGATPNSNLYIFVYEPGAPVEPVATTIEIDPLTTTVAVNKTVKFTPTVRDQFNATMTGVEINWTTSNETVGTIDDTGLFTGVAVGLTTVTATAGNASASALVTVEASAEQPEAASITVKPPTTTLQIGGTHQFEATVLDQDGKNMTAEVTWTSSDPTVGTIDEDGLFTAVAEGTTNVTATVGEITGEATVTVSAEGSGEPVVTGITIDPLTATVAINETRQFTATVIDQDGKNMTAEVTWTSSDPTVGTIDEDGLFTALADGTMTVTATAGTVSASALVTVTADEPAEPVLDNLRITPSGATLAIGDTQQFIVTARDQDGNTMTNVSVNWTSSDETVGTMDETGIFTALAEGTANVTAETENITATVTVTIAAMESAPAYIAVSPSAITLNANETFTFSADTFDQFGSAMTDVEANWTSSDEDVGTIDTDGTFTALADGTTTVTATAENITGEATVTVATASSGVVVSPSAITLGAGESRQFTVHGLQDNADSAVDWSCDDEAVGTVDAEGLFTALADGIATITATAENETGTATVTVASSPAATRIEIEPATATILPGESRAFTATVFDQRDSDMDWIRVTWSSSNTDVGTIDRAGLFGAFAEGSTDITASAGEAAETAAVTVSTTAAPEPTPGGGGGGSAAYSDGGGGSSEPTFCARTCENLASGQTFTFSDLTTSSVGSVNVTAAGNIPRMMLTVKKTNTPSAAEPPANDVYEYVEIASSWVNPNLIGNATVFFSVPTDWFGARNVTPEDVRLMRYVNGAWESLETEVVGEEGGLYRFRATTPGFSTFAIAAVPSSLTASAEEIEDVTPEVTEPKVTGTPEVTEEVTTEPTETIPTTTPAAPLIYAPFLAPLAFLLWARRKN